MAGIIVKTCRYEDRRILYLSDLQQNFFAISFRTDEKVSDSLRRPTSGQLIISIIWRTILSLVVCGTPSHFLIINYSVLVL